MADWLSRATVDAVIDVEIDLISSPIYLTNDPSPLPLPLSPYLPTPEQWIELSIDIPTADKTYVKRGADNLWYSIYGGKLYVLSRLREPILFWFHASRYGGHLGINRTIRRISQWFYWPKMKKDITQYVSDCLLCKRIGAPNIRYLRQVLEKPLPFQMISCDHVGPREWNNERFHYLVIIDHYSRFVVAKEMKDLKTVATITVIRELWISHFGAPEAILVDRSASFTSRLFQEFMRNETAAHLIYSSAGYPQGNALNEAVHRGIKASIAARRTYKPTTSFSDVLRDTILAYNTTPHSSTNFSPYYSLFGKQMILPGLERFAELTPEVIIHNRIRDAQRQTMQRAIRNTDRQLRLYHPAVINVGDQVVYYLQLHERRIDMKEEGKELLKYSPTWSLAMSLLSVQNDVIEMDIGEGR